MERSTAGLLAADRRIRSRGIRRQVLPANRPFRTEGLDTTWLAGHRSPVRRRQLAAARAVAAALPQGYQPDSARNERSRHEFGSRRLRQIRPARAGGGIRHAGAAFLPTAICWAASFRR